MDARTQTQASDRQTIPLLLAAAAGCALGATVAPGLTLAHPAPIPIALALAVTLLAALAGPDPLLAPLGVAIAALGAWLLAQITFPLTIWLIAALCGLGAGLAVPRRRWLGSAAIVAALLVAALLVAVRYAVGVGAMLVVGAGAVALAGVAAVALSGAHRRRPTWVTTASLVLAVLLTLGSASWVGASTPHAAWFGTVVWHGPRDSNLVALTFDDGPNANDTLKVRDILDEYGVKATFFTVGKALVVRPDISRALLADGMLLADHSYHHDSTSWLEPNYREIPLTQAAFKRLLGVCPAFYRPPHGTHTPFMDLAARERGMTMITWDVSAGDWATTDGQLVAQRVLDRVQPGSIILLHDGLDGNVTADRSVLLTALPLILNGLKARGLHPVTLDKLLGKPGYVPC